MNDADRCTDCGHLPGCDCPHWCTPNALHPHTRVHRQSPCRVIQYAAPLPGGHRAGASSPHLSRKKGTMTSSMTTATRSRPGAETASCPSWCVVTHGYGEIHASESREVPTAEPVHLCGYFDDPDEDFTGACDVPNRARLHADDGVATMSVGHGDDWLPAMTIDQAEQLARRILSLVAAARNA